jgi:TATA-binding protein-associated factor
LDFKFVFYSVWDEDAKDGGSCLANEDILENDANKHRALIFCQYKSMVDLICTFFDQSQIAGVTYARMDGSVPPNERHAIVERFNRQHDIRVLVLTVQVMLFFFFVN